MSTPEHGWQLDPTPERPADLEAMRDSAQGANEERAWTERDDLDDFVWTWRDSAWVRWIQVRAWFRRCPDCRRRGHYPDSPRWDEDKTARMFGLPIEGHCPNCGKREIT